MLFIAASLFKVREALFETILESLKYSIATGTTFGFINDALIKLRPGRTRSAQPAGGTLPGSGY